MRLLYFVGVSTAESSIMRIFPAWARHLGIDAEVRGIDLPVRAGRELLREVVGAMAAEPRAAGALVTTHKAAMFDAARDLFSELDEWAELCQEISCIAIGPGAVRGWAKDPITARQAYTHLLGPDPWSGESSDVVCLGAGGAGLALTVSILGAEHQPRRYVLVDRDRRRLDVARTTIAQLDVHAEMEYHLAADSDICDRLVSGAAPGSFVVNATGMGKDAPGSPLSDAVIFPKGAVAWDMNYRGDLRFLDIAAGQQGERSLLISDGWQYFLHGWTEVIAEVFGVRVDGAVFEELIAIGETVTGRQPELVAAEDVSRG